MVLDDHGVCCCLSADVENEDQCVTDWWSEGKLSVCVARWSLCKVDDVNQFYAILKKSMPNGTKIFGYVRRSERIGTQYCAMLGFSFRLGSWQGLEDRLNLKLDDGGEDCSAFVEFSVGKEGVRMNAYVEEFQELVRMLSGQQNVTFGEPLKKCSRQEGESELPVLLEKAEQMWGV